MDGEFVGIDEEKILRLIRDAKRPRKPKQRVTFAEPSDLPPKKRYAPPPPPKAPLPPKRTDSDDIQRIAKAVKEVLDQERKQKENAKKENAIPNVDDIFSIEKKRAFLIAARNK